MLRVGMKLYEDVGFLCVAKPAGVSMATSRRRPAEGAVTALLSAAGIEWTGPLPLLVHRLDVGTSGVVLLAKNEAAHRRAATALAERRARKTYRALVWGHPVP